MTSTTPASAPRIALDLDLDLCFIDGTVILVAENTVFRTYKGLLIRHSKAFRDVFAGDPGGDSHIVVAPETTDGCPVVCCIDATAFDVKHFLHAIVDGLDDKAARNASTSVVTAQMRLGTQYGSSAVVAAAYSGFSKLFPPALDDWYARPRCDDKGAIEAINFIRAAKDAGIDFDLEEHLVPAFYMAAQLDDEVVWRGTARADGTWEVLSAEDIARVGKLKAWLRKRYSRLLIHCSEQGKSESCLGWKYCDILIPELDAGGDPCEPVPPGDPLESEWMDCQIEGMVCTGIEDLDLCPECGKHLRTVAELWRGELWDDISHVLDDSYEDEEDNDDEDKDIHVFLQACRVVPGRVDG